MKKQLKVFDLPVEDVTKIDKLIARKFKEGGTAILYELDSTRFNGRLKEYRGISLIYKKYKTPIKDPDEKIVDQIWFAINTFYSRNNKYVRHIFGKTCNIPVGLVVENKRTPTLCGLLLEPIGDTFYFLDKESKKQERTASHLVSNRYSKTFDRIDITNHAHLKLTFLDSLSFGVSGLHAIGIPHGDLNSKNILFDATPLGSRHYAQCYIIDTFNGYGIDYGTKVGKRHKIISPLPDPYTLSNMILDGGNPNYNSQDVFQVAAWCTMILFTQQFLTDSDLHSCLLSYNANNRTCDKSNLSSAIKRHRENILQPAIDSIKDSLHNKTLLNVTHSKRFVSTLVAALGPINNRPDSHELYREIHDEMFSFT